MSKDLTELLEIDMLNDSIELEKPIVKILPIIDNSQKSSPEVAIVFRYIKKGFVKNMHIQDWVYVINRYKWAGKGTYSIKPAYFDNVYGIKVGAFIAKQVDKRNPKIELGNDKRRIYYFYESEKEAVCQQLGTSRTYKARDLEKLQKEILRNWQ